MYSSYTSYVLVNGLESDYIYIFFFWGGAGWDCHDNYLFCYVTPYSGTSTRSFDIGNINNDVDGLFYQDYDSI